MRDALLAGLLAVLLLFAAFLLLWAIAADREARNPIPRCAEDAVLIGTGDFERGRWDRYVCGPAVDDF